MQHNAVGLRLAGAREILANSRTVSLQDQARGTSFNTIYKFTIRNRRSFNLKLRGLNGPVDVELIQDTNRNNRTNLGETLASSRGIGSQLDIIRFNQLQPGTYYIRVFSNRNARYELNVSAGAARNPSFAEQVLTLTNRERLRNGLLPLAWNTQLSLGAQRHSQDMALNDFFSHTGFNGSSPSQRVKLAGYPVGAGENAAAAQSTPVDVVNSWMNSSGHRANILSSTYSEIGVGYFHLAQDTGSVNWNHYWTQTFSNPNINFF